MTDYFASPSQMIFTFPFSMSVNPSICVQTTLIYKRKNVFGLIGFYFQHFLNDFFRNILRIKSCFQEEEPYLPWHSRLPRNCTSFVIVVLMVCLDLNHTDELNRLK